MEAQKKFSYLDEFKIVKTLGAGYHAIVKLAIDENGRYVAIKRYKKETANLNTLKHQLSIMKDLNHENLVKLIDVRQNATYKSRHEVVYQCFAIILEYVGGGELFDYIADTGKFSQKVSRTYFHQMMNGLHHMHSKGYAHRDIKPENILLSHQFVLKLADFGFSNFLKGRDGSGILHTKLGTEGYMAPEIPTKNYQGAKTDIFAAGVILFIMYAGNPPFQKAAANDPYYKLIKEKNLNVFWSAHSRRRPANFFNDKFKDLFTRMIAFEPNERITIEQIAQHPWVVDPISSYNEIKQEFTIRQSTLDKVVNNRREQQEKKKQQRLKGLGSQGHHPRAGQQLETQFFESYSEELQNKRVLPHLRLANKDDIVVKEELPYIISNLKNFFKNKKIQIEKPSEQQLGQSQTPFMSVKNIKDNENKLTVIYEYKYGHEKEEIIEQVEILLTFGKSDSNQIVIRIERESGNQLYFKKIIRQIKNQLSYCLV